jgi:hypothetical protein
MMKVTVARGVGHNNLSASNVILMGDTESRYRNFETFISVG